MPHGPTLLSRRQLFLLAGAAARVGASEQDFWNSKPAAEWSTSDIYQLANHSPWANPVQAWSFSPFGGRDEPSGGIALPTTTVTLGPQGVVTWESAQPLRKALKTPLPRAFANLYVIGVDGIPSGSRFPSSLQRVTVLRCGGKPKWTVRASVPRELIRTSAVYAFGFPKAAAPIGPDSGDVVFETQFGPWMVRATFKPKDMLYRGQLAL